VQVDAVLGTTLSFSSSKGGSACRAYYCKTPSLRERDHSTSFTLSQHWHTHPSSNAKHFLSHWLRRAV